VSIKSFTVNIGPTMSRFKALTQFATKGATSLQVGVILPDTTSSTRYVNFDAPYLNAAFADAGYTRGIPRRSTGSTTRREATRPS
jgi:D-xylose transport system substrate-binding protein